MSSYINLLPKQAKKNKKKHFPHSSIKPFLCLFYFYFDYFTLWLFVFSWGSFSVNLKKMGGVTFGSVKLIVKYGRRRFPIQINPPPPQTKILILHTAGNFFIYLDLHVLYFNYYYYSKKGKLFTNIYASIYTSGKRKGQKKTDLVPWFGLYWFDYCRLQKKNPPNGFWMLFFKLLSLNKKKEVKEGGKSELKERGFLFFIGSFWLSILFNLVANWGKVTWR